MPLVNGRILLDRIQEKRVLAGAFGDAANLLI